MPVLYHLTLEKGAGISKAVLGSFTHSRAQEVFCVNYGCNISLLRINESGKISLVLQENAFGIIRSVCAFRPIGSSRDMLALGSDSGKLVIISYEPSLKRFKRVHQETFGRSGVKRVIAGDHLAVDPKGRVVMIGALERQKFVFTLNRDSENRSTISSPLEAHKSNHLCFDMVALDVGSQNPVIVTLEVSFESIDSLSGKMNIDRSKVKMPLKHIAFWEVDLGLNHIVKKYHISVDRSAHLMVPVPSGDKNEEGPGGVLVCCESFMVYKKPDHPDIICAYPRRLEMEQSKGLLISSYATYKIKDFFFVLIQSEFGDLYKVELIHKDAKVTELVCRYFDTIPIARSLCVLRTGFLFAAMESGPHRVYQFINIGADETRFMCSSLHPHGKNAVAPFRPRNLKNMCVSSQQDSFAPMTDFKVIDCVGDPQCPQIYTLCGRGPQSSLKILRHGLQVNELAASELPGSAVAVWTLKEKQNDEFDAYILIVFRDSSLVLKVGDSIEELQSPLFTIDRPTLFACSLFNDAHLQVLDNGFKQMSLIGSAKRVTQEWVCPSGKRIVAADCNGSQLVFGLTGGTLVLFNQRDRDAPIMLEMGRKELEFEITCVCVQPLPPGSLMSPFCAIGAEDRTVRIYSIQTDKVLFRQTALQMLFNDAHAHSVQLAPFPLFTTSEGSGECILCIGLTNGVLMKVRASGITGQIEEERRLKFMGPSPVNLTRSRLSTIPTWLPSGVKKSEQRQEAQVFDSKQSEVVTVSSIFSYTSQQVSLIYPYGGVCETRPLICNSTSTTTTNPSTTTTGLAAFSSVHCKHSFVMTEGKLLRICSIDPISSESNKVFSSISIDLSYTPRKLSVFPPPPTSQERFDAKAKGTAIALSVPTRQRPWLIAVIESDHNAFDETTKQQLKLALTDIDLDGPGGPTGSEANNEENNPDANISNQEDKPTRTEPTHNADGPSDREVGTFQAGQAKWGSTLRLIDPVLNKPVQKFPFEPDEAAFAMSVCHFLEYPYHPALVVATACKLDLETRKCQRAAIKVFVYDEGGALALLHSTTIEDVCMALTAWNGRLLCGVGNKIRLYSLGRKQLLKRCEHKSIPECIVWLKTSGDRIFASDVREGLHVLEYNTADNVMNVIADGVTPRWITCADLLDPFTAVAADKFNNVFVSRVPPDAVDADAIDTTGLRVRTDTAYLTGSCAKLTRETEFHLGETITGIQKTLLSPGVAETVVYGTITGSIGVLLPIQSSKEIEFLNQFEMLMRNEGLSLVGRDIMSYRSAYFPVKNTIDGDLLECYTKLTHVRQTAIASILRKTPIELVSLLDDIRNRIL